MLRDKKSHCGKDIKFPELIYKLKKFQANIGTSCFVNVITDSKLPVEEPIDSQLIWENKPRGLTLPRMKMHQKVNLVKTTWCGCRGLYL